ncbi:MAG: hypothetical protein ACRENO_05575 [Thermodesulfobacteriota bacterium]
MRAASIDLGTNTFEILIADKIEKRLTVIEKKLTITRLGGGYDRNAKILSENSIKKSLNVMSDYSNLLKKYDVKNVKAVATSVLRDASNSTDFLRRLFINTGITVEIISGIEEARLSSLGVINSLKIDSRYCLVVDIGGGSTEFSLLKEDSFLRLFSADLGVVHLTENYINTDIPTALSLLNIKEVIIENLKPIIDNILSIADINDLSLVCNAGTPSTVACSIKRLNKFNPKLVNGCIISRNELIDYFDEISSIPAVERLKKYPSIEKGREDLIICGVLILDQVLCMLSKERFKVSEAGLLEGLLCQMH